MAATSHLPTHPVTSCSRPTSPRSVGRSVGRSIARPRTLTTATADRYQRDAQVQVRAAARADRGGRGRRARRRRAGADPQVPRQGDQDRPGTTIHHTTTTRPPPPTPLLPHPTKPSPHQAITPPSTAHHPPPTRSRFGSVWQCHSSASSASSSTFVRCLRSHSSRSESSLTLTVRTPWCVWAGGRVVWCGWGRVDLAGEDSMVHACGRMAGRRVGV